MSVEQTREYLKRYATDADFRARLQDSEPGERARVLDEAGFGDIRPEHFEQIRAESGEIDLDSVAGGTAPDTEPVQVQIMEAMLAVYNTGTNDIINKGGQMG